MIPAGPVRYWVTCKARRAQLPSTIRSLLQLDFGEREQDKSVNLVEVHPRRPAEVTQLSITAGRRLIDVGTPHAGVALNVAAYAAVSPGRDLPRLRRVDSRG
jgi:hypothetical protein